MKVNVEKAPQHVRKMLENVGLCVKIASSFDEIEAVILEAQRNITTVAPQGEEGAMIRSIDHLLKHFRLFRDVGAEDIKNRENHEAKDRTSS